MIPNRICRSAEQLSRPAEHWMTANNRTNELDVNAVVTHETFNCCVCGKMTSFTSWRVPRSLQRRKRARSPAMSCTRTALCSAARVKGVILDGTPGKDAYYTGYHWTKAMCDTRGTTGSNGKMTGYGFNRNVYNLYDCASEFMENWTIP